VAIGERIKIRREQLNIAQDELAKKIGYKSRSSINKIEMGHYNLTQSKIKAIADALETTPGYIMGWDEIDENANMEKLSVEVVMWDFIGKRYGERIAEQLNALLQLKPVEQERIWKLLEGYFKLDNEDRIILLSRAYQILEDMLEDEKYSSSQRHIVKIAARNGTFEERTMTDSEIEDIMNLPDVDDLK